MVKIDIIIVTYNAKEKLKRCLQSLRRYTHTFDYRLTIVNNNSSDGTAEYLERYNAKINIINNKKNLGFSKAANTGLKNATNKYIALLDDDVEVSKGWLDKLYNQMRNKPKAGIVGCKILFPDKRVFCSNIFIANKMFKELGKYEIDKGQRDYIREVDAINGSCWLMRKELIKRVGYFDERFFPSQYEDIDYCIKTRLAGYKIIYNGEIKIIHHHLLRDGGEEQNKKNIQKFLKRWKDLSMFPLKDSHPVDKCIARGLGCLKKRRFKQALLEFKRAESIDKRFSEPFHMGIALEGMGKYNDAIQQFEKALSLNSSNVSVHLHMAVALKETGEYRRAVQELKKVLSVEPSNFSAQYYLTFVYKKLGMVKEAKRESLKIFNFVSSNKELLSQIR